MYALNNFVLMIKIKIKHSQFLYFVFAGMSYSVVPKHCCRNKTKVWVKELKEDGWCFVTTTCGLRSHLKTFYIIEVCGFTSTMTKRPLSRGTNFFWRISSRFGTCLVGYLTLTEIKMWYYYNGPSCFSFLQVWIKIIFSHEQTSQE